APSSTPAGAPLSTCTGRRSRLSQSATASRLGWECPRTAVSATRLTLTFGEPSRPDGCSCYAGSMRTAGAISFLLVPHSTLRCAGLPALLRGFDAEHVCPLERAQLAPTIVPSLQRAIFSQPAQVRLDQRAELGARGTGRLGGHGRLCRQVPPAGDGWSWSIA